jgi:DMSO/TMAO reductase YedYZ molybdopterin-dependent catalytic subunit
MADLKGMSAVSGYGGWKNQLGNITAPMAWKGVSVNALLDLVGGGGSARVVASDGYEATLSGAELSGQMNVYDPATGEAISSFSGSLRVIVAYAKNGSGLGGEGPLRIAFVSPEKDQVTDSDQWVKNVVSIKAR